MKRDKSSINTEAFKEQILLILFALLGIAILILSSRIHLMYAVEKSSIVNARFYPKIVGFCLIILSIASLSKTFIKPHKTYENNTIEKETVKLNNLRTFFFIILCVIYIFCFFILGFFIPTVLFLFIIFFMLDRKKTILKIFISIAIPALIWFLFSSILNVPLPKAIIF